MNTLMLNIIANPTDDSITVLKLQGHLDAETVKQLAAFHDAEKAQSRYKWVVDLSELEFISSAGLGFFMGILSEMRHNGGDIVFAGLSPRILKIFNVLGVAQMFQIVENDAAGLSAYKF
jgi:anti-sigma B factor antagonist